MKKQRFRFFTVCKSNLARIMQNSKKRDCFTAFSRGSHCLHNFLKNQRTLTGVLDTQELFLLRESTNRKGPTVIGPKQAAANTPQARFFYHGFKKVWGQ